MLPEAKKSAVETACRLTFGQAGPSKIEALVGGLSGAAVFRIEVAGRPYVLRVEQARDALRDPVRWIACMTLAAQAGLAPHVHYADAEQGVCIMDWVDAQFISSAHGGDRSKLLAELGGMIRRLHDGPAFPGLVDYVDGLEQMTEAALGSGLLSGAEAEAGRAAFDRLAQAYRQLPPDLVASHNDLNPRNMLWDGRRVWYIDWEAAFQADRYVDLAAVANFFAREPDTESAFMAAYFGDAPSAAQRARLQLARRLNHAFYAMGMTAA